MGKPNAAPDAAKLPVKKPPGLNIRRARAGLFVLQGMSLKQALMKAGYAEVTARAPTANGLTAERCLLEASKLDKSSDPGTMLEAARRLGLRQVRAWLKLGDSRLTDKVGALAIPRLVETIERYHGAADVAAVERESRSFVDRAFTMRAVIEELDKRGMLKDENAGSRDAGRVLDALPDPASKETDSSRYPPPTKEPEY